MNSDDLILLCSPEDKRASFNPSKIDKDAQKLLWEGIPEHISRIVNDLQIGGWRIFAVDQERGRCYLKDKIITIPVWAIKKHLPGYKIWYLSHELSHALCWEDHKNLGTEEDNHGPIFMEMLKRICPEDYIHYELSYKPRNAAKAGIRRKD